MKKFLIIFIFSIALAVNADRYIYPQRLFENAEGVLCLFENPFADNTADSIPLSYRDTILADGTVSRSYFLPYSAPPLVQALWGSSFVYWQFPDGVRIILSEDSTSFLYPSGLKPNLYNLVPEQIVVTKDNYNPDNPNEGNSIDFNYINTRKHSYSKPSPTSKCQYVTSFGTEVSMYANVKVLDESEAFIARDTPKYYVRVIEPDSDEKADFDVHIVKNHRWGTDCAQWRWVDCDEDFCVIFGFGGDFKIRIIDDK